MKLSMWIVNDWLDQYSPEPRISEGDQTISGVRYLSDELELSDNYLYIGETFPYAEGRNGNIICVNRTDLITLTAPDIYLIFNEIQKMMEFYNDWETKILQAINRDEPLTNILAITAPVLKTGVAFTDISHKILADAHYGNVFEHELKNGFLREEELRLINDQLRGHMNTHLPYVIQALNTRDIVRNFYSRNGDLIGWFVAMDGGGKPHLQSRLQLSEVFCNLMDLWFKIHVGENFSSNLFLDVLEENDKDPESISLRLSGIGWTENPDMQLLVLRSCSDDDLGITMIRRYLENNFSGLSCFPFHIDFVVVLNYHFVEKDAFFKYLKSLLISQNSRCGISYPFTDPMQLKQKYLQALCALEYGKNEKGAVNRCEDYALDYWRSCFKSVLNTDMTSPVLKQLKKHDEENGTDYYNTLRVYLLCERDQTLAAKTLCIHRNSLVYRVNRLKEMLEIDLDSADIRLHILLSYFVSDT